MELYADQLRGVLDMVEALNAWDQKYPEMLLRQPIVLMDGGGDGTVLGEFLDEIGGCWSFKAAGGPS